MEKAFFNVFHLYLLNAIIVCFLGVFFFKKQVNTSLFIIFVLMLNVPVNSYDHVETVSSPNHTFSWASLTKRLTSTLCIYFRM